MNETIVTQETVQQVVATDKQQVIATTEVVSTVVSVGQQGPAGPVGPVGPQGIPGPNTIGSFGFNINELQAGDHLEFAGSNWVNVAKQTLSDGGNF